LQTYTNSARHVVTETVLERCRHIRNRATGQRTGDGDQNAGTDVASSVRCTYIQSPRTKSEPDTRVQTVLRGKDVGGCCCIKGRWLRPRWSQACSRRLGMRSQGPGICRHDTIVGSALLNCCNVGVIDRIAAVAAESHRPHAADPKAIFNMLSHQYHMKSAHSWRLC
jgi:hypothetical protein